jgi:hypothetical protein
MTSTLTTTAAAIDRLEVAAYTIPTDAPEADGTDSWDKTTLVLVEIASGDQHGLGYTYADRRPPTWLTACCATQCCTATPWTSRPRGRRWSRRSATSLSAHCAPSLHVHPCCAAPPLCHLEYFHDHVRIEHMLFDGALSPTDGVLRPDLSRPGMGLEFKHEDARRYLTWKK